MMKYFIFKVILISSKGKVWDRFRNFLVRRDWFQRQQFEIEMSFYSGLCKIVLRRRLKSDLKGGSLRLK